MKSKKSKDTRTATDHAEKDYALLNRALNLAHSNRVQPDDIADDLFFHNTFTDKLSMADKLSMVDLLINITRNYHAQIVLEIQNNETMADYHLDGDDIKSVNEFEKIQKLLHRVIATHSKIHSASDSVYDQYQDYLTDELDTDENNS